MITLQTDFSDIFGLIITSTTNIYMLDELAVLQVCHFMGKKMKQIGKSSIV